MTAGDKLSIISLILLLIICFAIRITNLSLVNYTEDGYQNYLVARHIAKYGETVSVGTMEGALGLKHPAAYYYLLSLPLKLIDDYNFLAFLNLLLQISLIVITYLLAKEMFDRWIGLTAAIIIGLSPAVISQSNFLWTPWVMQPFLNLSLFLLLLSYTRFNYFFLLLSLALFFFSTAIHYSVVALIPIYLLLVFLILKKQNRSLEYYLLALLEIISITLVLYYSLIIEYLKNPPWQNLPASQNNFFFENINFLNDTFIPESITFNHNAILMFTILALLIYYFYSATKPIKKYIVIICACILSVLTLASLFKLNHYRYLSPIFSLTAILISCSLFALIQRKTSLWPTKVIVLILTIILYVPTTHLANGVWPKKHPVIDSLKNDVLYIQSIDKKADLKFFQLQTYKGLGQYDFVNAFFWASLEKELDSKFTQINNYSKYNYETTNEGDYVYLICYSYTNVSEKNENCLNAFSRNNSNYQLIRNIYNLYPFSVYSTKRIKYTNS